ncbi:16S rRNA (cytidine(1402)-2'-O)-methyltransferase [Patescibacteria group bacterium]|nr:16S rRNA (cytidine(1402)-2'-O)-methyltransferase [Patescibacteria group bacterium]
MNNENLYLVATPIGNLEDITFRAINVLKSVDVVLCEDTRQSKKLLDHYQIEKKMISLHQHSSDEKILRMLNEYKNIAYISDAGTPGISDPGNKLVAKAIELGKNVFPIPGASAVISALSIAGFPTDKFVFLGFMPHKGKGKIFEAIKNSQYTVAFYESPHRILRTLEEMKNYLEPERKVVVAREMTKKFETVYRGSVEEILKQVKPKGEFVVIVEKK